MQKKTIIKIVIFIFIIFGIMYFLHDKDKGKKSLEKQDEQRIESIKDYDANQSEVKTIDDDTDDITNGGDAKLINRADFLKMFNDDDLDVAIAICNNIVASSLKYTDTINSDCTLDNISEYFTQNKQTLYNIFGIETEEEFQDIFNKIDSIGELQDVQIDIDTVKVVDNGANFYIYLNGTQGECNLYIKAKVNRTSMNTNFFVQG